MADDQYEPQLPSTEPPFSLTDEQRDTARRLNKILGRSISERYIDFCRLAYGKVPLRAPSPFAAHALRELNSSFQDSLESLAGVKRTPTDAEKATMEKARKALEELDVPKDVIDGALNKFGNDNYASAIRKITAWLGLNPNGDIAKAWIKFKDLYKKVHERKFNRPLLVDDEFRDNWARPFDMVARAVAIALEGKYAALMNKVGDLAAMTDPSAALTRFEKEVPGAQSLQWHFYTSLDDERWLPEIIRRELIIEPVRWAEDEEETRLYGEWPVGAYLKKMAQNPSPEVRALVIVALRSLASSTHPDVRRNVIEIVSHLPANEIADLADMVTGWLSKDSYLIALSASEKIVVTLAQNGFKEKSLKVAGALFQVIDKKGNADSLYSRGLYEHSVPRVAATLTKFCSVDALDLFADLLLQAAVIERKIEFDPPNDYTSIVASAISEEETAYDIYGALVQAVKKSASFLIEQGGDVHAIMDVLARRPYRVFNRLALHILAKNPAGAPDHADTLLLNSDNMEQYNFRHEYAELACARFPAMDAESQNKLLALIDAMPGKYLENYKARVLAQEKREATKDELEAFVQNAIRDVTYYWRHVLPQDRQDALAAIVNTHGDPDSWFKQFEEPEVSPRSAADFATAPVADTVAYLKAWMPGEDPVKQTKTALALELRNAVNAEPLKFSAGALEFKGAPLIYIRRLIEGLRTPMQNKAKIEWRPVLELILSVLPTVQPPRGPDQSFTEDDPTKFWAAKEAGELVRSGLSQGKDGIPYDCADLVKSLMGAFEKASSISPEQEHFSERYADQPYFAAEQTMFGITADIFVLYLFWSSKHTASPIAVTPHDAIANTPEFKAFAERALAQTGDNGKIARVVLGRYLTWLYYFGAEWVKGVFPKLAPADGNLADSAWLGHLLNDRPSKDLVPLLEQHYRKEISRLQEAPIEEKREPRANRVSEYLMVLMLWDALPQTLLEQFERDAPPKLRRHAMWFVGREMRRADVPKEIHQRGMVYWNRRLKLAEEKPSVEQFGEELGVAGYWGTDSTIPVQWLMDQYLRMLRAGYAPGNSFSVVEWLGKVAPDNPDQAVEVFDLLISNAKTDRWATTGQQLSVNVILEAGQKSGLPLTLDRIDHVVSLLASSGDPAYLGYARRS